MKIDNDNDGESTGGNSCHYVTISSYAKTADVGDYYHDGYCFNSGHIRVSICPN